MTKRADVNRVLKGLGLQNLRFAGTEFGRGKTIKDGDGKMIKGVPAATHSPMDVTEIANNLARAKLAKCADALAGELGAQVVDRSSSYVKMQSGRLSWMLRLTDRPRYPRSSQMDPGYVQSAVEVDFL